MAAAASTMTKRSAMPSRRVVDTSWLYTLFDEVTLITCRPSRRHARA
jgi:hypothetical protein